VVVAPASAAQNAAPMQSPQSVPPVASPKPADVQGAAAALDDPSGQAQLSAPESGAPPATISPNVTVASFAPPASLVPEASQRYVAQNTALAAAAIAPPTGPASATMIQIMALSHQEDADAMVSALKRQGYDVAVTRDSRDQRLHLEVGPFKDKTDAEATRQRLLTDGYNATVR